MSPSTCAGPGRNFRIRRIYTFAPYRAHAALLKGSVTKEQAMYFVIAALYGAITVCYIVMALH